MGTNARTDIVHEETVVHDLAIVFPDSVLETLDPGHEVRVTLRGRGRDISKKLSYREVQHLLGHFKQQQY
jgi:hypothetical protein